MPLKGLFKGDGGGGGGRDGSSGGSSSRDSSTHSGRDGKLMSKAKALLATAAAPLSARGRERASDRPYFNPEEHISEKREWSRRYTQSQGGAPGAGLAAPKPPDRLFEHFAVVGLAPTMNIKAVAADIKTFQRLSREAGGLGGGGAAAAAGMEVTADTPREEKQRQYGLKGPAHPAQVLYCFPSAMPADLEQGLAAFCFPHGVRPELLERTPSMSALNEVIYSQPYQTHDDHSFVFTMKVVDPGSIAPRTLYGVCCYVRELVHRPPSMAREAYAGCNAPLNRYLVVAPRCYCLLTHHPFFALHFRVLQTILGLERLERMTSFAAELAGLQEGGQPGASWASSSLASSSVDAGSTASLGQGPSSSGGTGPAAAGGAGGGAGRGTGAPAAPLAAATAAGAVGPRAGEPPIEEDGSETGSSRRWTEGSSVAADGQQQAADLAAALLELSLPEQRQLQAAQTAEQPRPARMAQVSPHCPEVPAGTPGSGRQGAAGAVAGEAEGAEEEQAATPPKQQHPSSLAAAVGPTPFFTPAGLSSALGTPAGHSRTVPWEQAAAAGGQPDGAGGTRRALEGMLAEAGGSSTGSPAGSAPAAAGSPAAEGAADQADAGDAAGVAAATAAASNSRPGSAQEQEQSRPESDDGSSDAESYLTASSSTALLAQQVAGLDASPATAAFLAGSAHKAQHARSVSGTSLVSVGATAAAASPAPAAAPLLDASEAGEQQQGGEEAPAMLQLLLDQGQHMGGQGGAAQPPLLDLEAEQEQQQEQQQQLGSPGQQQAAGAAPEQQQQQALLVGSDAPSQETPVKAAPQQGAAPAPAVQEQLAQLEGGLLFEETPVKEQQLGSGVAVRIVRRSYSSPAQGHGVADTPPRADLLTGSAVSRSARHPLSLPPTLLEGSREGSAAISAGSPASSLLPPEAQQGGGGAPADAVQQRAGEQQPPPALQAQQAQQQAQQEQWAAEGGLVRHEVVRVTASNLDMSRPLRSADLLAVYHASVVPRPGQVFEFQPDPGLQTIQFERPDLVEAVRELGLRPDASSLPDIDAAQNLGGWAVAALCRAMSLDSILTFLTAALLERQIVVFCPNAGLLSGVVLSLVPLLLPFHWQCLLLPVLPAAEGRLELMEAPVPFVLGVLYKTPEVRAKCSSLVRVNVYKDKVKNAGNLPPLPQQAALHDALAGTYAELRKIGLTRAATTRPVHMISDAQQVLAECFLSTLQKYLKGLMADLRAYCITDVSASMERTSVLLKESFVDSFPPRDRTFMRQFAETQMFAVYTDAVLG